MKYLKLSTPLPVPSPSCPPPFVPVLPATLPYPQPTWFRALVAHLVGATHCNALDVSALARTYSSVGVPQGIVADANFDKMVQTSSAWIRPNR